MNQTADQLRSDLIANGSVTITLPLWQAKFLDRMLKTHESLLTRNESQKVTGFSRWSGAIKGICYSVVSSLCLRNVAETFDFYVLNRMRILHIHREKSPDGNGVFVFTKRQEPA